MTTVTALREVPAIPDPARSLAGRIPIGVLAPAAVAAALRLPFIGAPLGRDEAGYLEVAAQWHHGGSSLYGNLWVDRPPVLITLYQVADALGGTFALRLIGILGVVVAVLAIGHAARGLAGSRAATWASIATAALLVNPLSGATEVNGELLAAPFIAVGIASAVDALLAGTRRRILGAAALSGATAVCAVLVKQNMVDVLVFGGVLLLLSLPALGRAKAVSVLLGAFGGALATLGVVGAWTVAHGTSLSGVWFAMYRFRVEAARVMAANPSPNAPGRAQVLALAAVGTGMALFAVLLLVVAVRSRRDHPSSSEPSRVAAMVPFALLATAGYDVVSIVLGNSYWSHYLVQAAVPLALAAGLASHILPRITRPVIALAVLSAAIALIGAPHTGSSSAARLGRSIAGVSHPGDTIVTAWGRADISRASGLPTPYPYLWSLPAHTLDPDHAQLLRILTGPHAPTWYVDASRLVANGPARSTIAGAIEEHYHAVGHGDHAVVYLRNGVRRAPPEGGGAR